MKVKIGHRGNKRKSATKTVVSIENNFPDDKVSIEFYISKLTDLRDCLDEIDLEIMTIILENDLMNEEQQQKEYTECGEYHDKITYMLAQLKNCLATNTTTSGSSLPKLRLPDVELPSFGGKPEEYFKFIDNFETILSKFDLTQFEKSSYLQKYVFGPAKEIIESVPLGGGHSYDTAKQLLSDAFSRKVVQQFSVVENLLKLKLTRNSDSFRWISEARLIAEQIHRLDISNEVFVQHFLWNSLATNYRECYMNMIKTSKPSLNEILDNAFKVFERMKENPFSMNMPCKSLTNGDEAVALATRVAAPVTVPPNYTCQLCSADDTDDVAHHISKCTVYPSPQSKVNKLISLSGCTRCGLLNHSVKNCKFRFKGKCNKCNNYHAQLLCSDPLIVESSKEKEKAVRGKQPNVKSLKKANDKTAGKLSGNACIIEFNVMTAHMSSSNLIPTCTLPLVKREGKNTGNFQCMYDPASQSTFISEHSLSKIDYKVVISDVTIKGTYPSKMFKSCHFYFNSAI